VFRPTSIELAQPCIADIDLRLNRDDGETGRPCLFDALNSLRAAKEIHRKY